MAKTSGFIFLIPNQISVGGISRKKKRALKMTTSMISLFHHDLMHVKEVLYDTCGIKMSNLKVHSEGDKYGSCSFLLNGKIIEHRVSKITPTKLGQFVSIWKRNEAGVTRPFNVSDTFDFIIIISKSDEHFGQFIFPKSVLADRGIITTKGKEGKRGIRVYPPWEIVENKQAKQTQKWQLNYFFTLKKNNLTDLERTKKVFAEN